MFLIFDTETTGLPQNYNAPVTEIKGATHPGLLMGEHWMEAAKAVLSWLNNIK